MSIKSLVIGLIARRFGIEERTLACLDAIGKVGQPSEVLIPRELIPLGAHLVARGRLTLEFLQPNMDWVLPYWAVRQLDPTDPGFLPRGFYLYYLNHTHRNWTSIGNLGREREAIVDPRGLVTPWHDGWSLDVWLSVEGQLYVPSRLPQVEQRLEDLVPIVVTAFEVQGIRVTLRALACDVKGTEWVLEGVAVKNSAPKPRELKVFLSIRPYNPEGVSPVHRVEYREENGEGHFYVNGCLGLALPCPDEVSCSGLRRGDVSLRLPHLDGITSATCGAGLATAVAAYHLHLEPGAGWELMARMPLEKGKDGKWPHRAFSSLRQEVVGKWKGKLAQGMRVRFPDPQLQASFEANKAYLLLFHDGRSITPGPFTYHRFWFRDAAYMINALDKVGYHEEAREVLESYPQRQREDGFFVSQEGEWDANGQAIWAITEHYRLTGDGPFLRKMYPAIVKGVEWIERKRALTKAAPSPHYGLLPPGFSAEHLGPNDYFYWDDFWCLAGEREAAYAAEALGRKEDAERFRQLQAEFMRDIERSLEEVARRLGKPAIPASPYRRMDAGAIGSLVALYPLRLLAPDDERILNTLAALEETSFSEGVFFQHMGHAAFGTYLNLHIAQCHLFRRSGKAWPIIQWLLRHASPTFTWAEGIHPLTRAGGMGDGHHGWAAADWLLALRNLLLFEEDDHLVLTPALPIAWLRPGSVVGAEEAPTYFGPVSFTLSFREREALLEMSPGFRLAPAYVELNLPVEPVGLETDRPGARILGRAIRLPPDIGKVLIRLPPLPP